VFIGGAEGLPVGAIVGESVICCSVAEQKSDRPFDAKAEVTVNLGGSLLPLPKSVTTPVTSARKPFSKLPSSVQV